MVNEPGTYLMVEMPTTEPNKEGLSVQTVIDKCDPQSKAGCFQELAVQIGEGIFRANATGSFLHGKPIARSSGGRKHAFCANSPGYLLAYQHVIYIEHPMLRIIVDEEKAQISENFVEFSFAMKKNIIGLAPGMAGGGNPSTWPTPLSPCNYCEDGVCLCTNWLIDGVACRMKPGQDSNRPFKACSLRTAGAGKNPELRAELAKEVSNLHAMKTSTKFARARASCKAKLRSLVPVSNGYLSSVVDRFAKDCAVDAAEKSPDSKTMLEEMFCNVVESKIKAGHDCGRGKACHQAACKTIVTCLDKKLLKKLTHGNSCPMDSFLDVADLAIESDAH